jgi:hypothetical protein
VSPVRFNVGSNANSTHVQSEDELEEEERSAGGCIKTRETEEPPRDRTAKLTAVVALASPFFFLPPLFVEAEAAEEGI